MLIIAYCDPTGAIITETDCGAWTRADYLGVQANDGTVHHAEGIGARARIVARLLSEETSETVTANMVLDAWEAIRG